MGHSKTRPGSRGWPGVIAMVAAASLVSTIVSLGMTLALFGDLDAAILDRLLVSALILPTVLGGPVYAYFGIRLHNLTMANKRLGRVARLDSLTACLNRGAFTQRVSQWLNDPLTPAGGALVMIDADNFKAINDSFGHLLGDEALTIIARSIRSVLRSGDLVGRMGGEEFAVFLPGVNEEQAHQVAERIRNAVNTAAFTPDGVRHSLAVSLGGAVFTKPTTFAALCTIADRRLYGAKNAGRNRVTITEEAADDEIEGFRRRA